jgi:hypothetical protein
VVVVAVVVVERAVVTKDVIGITDVWIRGAVTRGEKTVVVLYDVFIDVTVTVG